ncbi:MAG: FG-GAP repeat protein, partial [Myxococcales bacterium]|nr:FG-GAP repeat protein [Myxococcales bacterium]
MMRARILFGLALVACARTPKPPADELPPEPPPDETSEAGTPAAAVPVPMTIASSSHPPAPWHLPPIDRVISPDALDGTFEDAAVGHSLALVRWAGGMLVVDADAGVRGTLALPPDAVWTGVDGDDRVLHATADGSVWRAESWDATPVRVGTVPGALAWDLAPHALVVLSESAVMRSTDGGARFEPLPPLPRRLDDPQILTRDDGAVVVQGRDESGSRQTLLLPPRGRRWVAGPAELGPLVRTGAWIGDAELDGCGTVLARDARRWVEAQLEDELARWSELAELEEELAPAPLRRLPTLTWPAAPRSSAACDGGADLWGAMGTGGTEDGEPIRGTTGPGPQPTARWARLLSDAVCDRLPDDEWSCDDAVPLRRAPHAAQWDERDRSLRIVSLPPACARPLRLDSAAGLGVLRCAEPSAVALWTLGPDGQWHGEGRLPHDDQAPGALTAADDGTLLLHGRCRLGSCERSWLRPPAALGEGAWVELDPADTLAFRVLDGGRALRIAGRRDQGYSLTVLEPGRPDQRLTTRLASEGRPLITMEVTPERTLRVAFGQEGPPIERMIDEHGRPQPVPPSPLRGGWRGPVLLANDSYPMVAAIGDYDDDGVDDLAVVQRQVAPHREVVVIVRGWGGLGELGPDALDGEDQVIVELDVPMLLVDELRGVGDVDGDGHDDLAITVVTPSSTGSGTEAETYVVLGRSTTDPRQLSAVRKGEGGFWIGGFPEGRSYAVTTGPLGDIDGDGRDDLGLSFPARGSDPGRLYVVLGKEGGS